MPEWISKVWLHLDPTEIFCYKVIYVVLSSIWIEWVEVI